MRKSLFITLAFSLTIINAFSQTNSLSKTEIESYIKFIDSLYEYPSKLFQISNFLEEGIITNELATTTKVGHKNKVDTVKKILKGGWSKSNYQNNRGDTIYKIEYHDNLQKNYYLIFYFKDNKLIYSKLDYQENGIGQTFYCREEFYNDNLLTFVKETPRNVDKEYLRRIDIDLYKRGQEYLEEFKRKK